MAVAKTSSSSSHESSRKPCNCYRVSGLAKPILETDQTLNLKDTYVLGEQLGWGQFGVIRECTDKLTREVLACKSIAKDRLVTSDDARSVRLEIEIMTRLSGHPNVVDLKAVFEDEEYVHLVMELCAGGELFHQLEKHGRFSEVEARVVFRQLMQVVLHCHETGVVHRDLKPENILLATKSCYSQIKLADFGLATYIKPGESLKGTAGSPFYIAPEVLAGGYNQSADVWSAGVILYILLSGTPPFWGKTKSRIFDAVRAADLRFPSDPWDCITEPAKELVKGMLCRDPSQRLTAQQVLDNSWMKDDGSYPLDSGQCGNQNCREWDFGGGSFSAFMRRDQDISFVMGSPSTCNVSSLKFICGSSISPFLGESSTCLASGKFSFRSDGNPSALEISSPIFSVPSFAFFDPGTETAESSCALDFSSKITGVSGIHGEGNTEEMLMLTKSSICCGNEAGEIEHRRAEVKRIGSRILGMLSKRNRTIGLGEREQLDLMVTESVIRWASCTHLPTAPSLSSSLVC